MLSMKPGRWLAWHVGVKAPGTATMTTFLFLNSIFQENGEKRSVRLEGKCMAEELGENRAALPVLASNLVGMPQLVMSLVSGVKGI